MFNTNMSYTENDESKKYIATLQTSFGLSVILFANFVNSLSGTTKNAFITVIVIICNKRNQTKKVFSSIFIWI